MDNPSFDELMHYGMPRRSGRYPWGSGDNPYQHEDDFLSRVQKLREIKDFTYMEDGQTYTGDLAIAKSMGLTTTQFRTQLALANSERRRLDVERAKSLRADGKSLNEIAMIMGYNNDSSIRSLLNESAEARMNAAQKTAELLKNQVKEKGMIDVGVGVEKQLKISREKLNEALYVLELEGYPVYGGRIPQVTNPGQYTTVKVLCPPGTEHKEIYNFGDIHSVTNDWVSQDGGESYVPRWVPPKSMDSSRLQIRYGDEGGREKDGVIELRRGVQDLDLGGAHYAQVRILVDGTHYLKGMAVYSDDLPDGVDVRFNTNKNRDVPVMGPKDHTILKTVKKDPNNPFGSLLKQGVDDPDIGTTGGGQRYYTDADGNKQLSLINKTREEGDWLRWSDNLPSQFLAKQNLTLINKQLDLAKADKKEEFDAIMELTNPAVKKALLQDFADDCDSTAVHLQAAALPRQKYQVILPLNSIKDTEVYAPGYNNGEKVALIRYPHAGTFELPILTVNNKLPEGKEVIGTATKDAVGINSKVAERLSGADFDGDTVMVIPCNNPGSGVHIVSTPPLKGLENFDPKMAYGGKPEGTFKKMTNTDNEMGKISNLIMDMTLKGASEEELARAVRHSMVVIDAEKHNLDYRASEEDNGIKALKKKYQGQVEPDGTYHEGVATLITKAKSPVRILKTKGSPQIDPNTGKQSFKTALTQEQAEEAARLMRDGKTSEEIAVILGTYKSNVDDLVYQTYNKKTGKTSVGIRTQNSTRMAETDDAHSLSSGTPQEEAYANYANYMKNLANEARKAMVNTKNIKYSPSAKATYINEYKSLTSKLNLALLNKPRERRAQALANSIVAAKKKDNPDLSKEDLKKIRNQALVDSRARVGAKRDPFTITDKEWEAIQAGAISANQLAQIVTYMDSDVLRQYATPRGNGGQLSAAKQAKIHAMVASGYTTAEIAKAVGVSTSTVSKYM